MDNIVKLAELVAQCETKVQELTECIGKLQSLIDASENLTRQ